MPNTVLPRVIWPAADGTVATRPNWPETEAGVNPKPQGTAQGNFNKDFANVSTPGVPVG